MVELLKTMEELNVIDIGFRMLDVDELAEDFIGDLGQN